MAKRGVSVGLIAPDTPFVNNYGVWLDEFAELGLEHTLLHKYDDALVWFNDTDPAEGFGLGRGYGQVCRRRLREELLDRCLAAGGWYAPGLVDQLVHGDADKGEPSVVRGTLNYEEGVTDGPRPTFEISARVVVCGTGHNRDMLRYDEGPAPGWQTAYGVEVKMPGHPFAVNKAVFMDFRQSDPELEEDGAGVWRVPSFLYVLPVDKDTVFVEETCLVARAGAVRRAQTSPLPPTQSHGTPGGDGGYHRGGGELDSARRYPAGVAAAHARLRRRRGVGAPRLWLLHRQPRCAARPEFAEVVRGLRDGGSVVAAERGWDVLWGDEPRRQVGFYQFGMELLMSLRIEQMRNFQDVLRPPRRTLRGVPLQRPQLLQTHRLRPHVFRAGQLGSFARSSSPTSRPPARASRSWRERTRIRCSAPPRWRTPRGTPRISRKAANSPAIHHRRSRTFLFRARSLLPRRSRA